jgi:ATPase subunit of ABC transporter with duplicated ATPase domains
MQASSSPPPSRPAPSIQPRPPDIIHYQQRQLRRYRGNLSEFVKAVPAAQSYYQLEAATLRFRFPTPGLLDGISSKEKPIIKLDKVSFTYPKAPRPQITDVHVMCRLSSRVAVLGVNGAGKSTLIKVIGAPWLFFCAFLWRTQDGKQSADSRHRPL